MLNHSRALPRRLLIAATGLALTAASLTALSTPASADDSPTTINVVGTSDVSDSNLINAVISPGFSAAYPQYKLNYIPLGTGAAIKYAEAGTADALIVHAASLENQFVAAGYSLEPYGRAIFYGDYILAGASSDPADVVANGSHDIVQAFEDIATKGGQTDASNNPEAYFVSRGGKQPPPGTVVQEDAIWALTTGVDTCQVSAANGGGAIPSTTDIGQPCPSTPTPPAWYVTNGGSQAQNINLANTCTFNGETNNDCYAFTDRGTYDYLESGGSTASPTTVPTNLKIVTRDNSATATGGNTLLTNTFHGYVINPATTNTTLNTVGATDLLDYITSTDGQTAIGQYLQGQDTTPPFLPDAAPDVTASNPPTSIQAGHSFTLTGSVTNLVPGTPALEGIKVTLNGTPTSAPASLAQSFSATTDSSGKYSITVKPTLNQLYTLTTPQIAKQLEYPDLSPQFYDQLQGTSALEGGIDVEAVIQNVTGSGSNGQLSVRGEVLPRRVGDNSHLSLYARPAGTTQAYKYHGRVNLNGGYSSFFAKYALAKGKWNYYVSYGNPGYVTPRNSAKKTVTVS